MTRDRWQRDELGIRAGTALMWENDRDLRAAGPYSAVVTRCYFAGYSASSITFNAWQRRGE